MIRHTIMGKDSFFFYISIIIIICFPFFPSLTQKDNAQPVTFTFDNIKKPSKSKLNKKLI